MALPLILSLLGSGAAGAGMLGTLSPLIAGALGSGLGTAIQTGDLGKGIQSGLTAGLLGGLGGMVSGGVGSATAAGGATGTALGANANVAPGLFGEAAAREAAKAGATGIRGAMATLPSGLQSSVFRPGTLTEMAKQGLNQGVLSGAGIGAAIPGAMEAMQPRMPKMEKYKQTYGPAVPFERNQIPAPAGYNPGVSPERLFFDRYSVPTPARLAGGGMISYTPAGMSQPIRMQAGGIADMMPGAQMEDPSMMGQEMMSQEMMGAEMAAPEMAQAPQQAPQMNDKQIVQGAILAIRGEIPEAQAAVVLGMFLEAFGEEALRRLVSDVRSGKVDGDRGDIEGMIAGPGDGMDDLVPAAMDDGSQDVLLSDGEFIVPADVVSGLGNGSTDAGAEELYSMMDRVRQERTGRTEQAPKVYAGGLMPA
jgi:hypothetical protein